jgi:hypothetical protein
MLADVIGWALILELITIFGRILFGSAKERLKTLNTPRIHHGYIGVLLSGAYLVFPKQILLTIGLALILSDLMHHFLVLPIWVKKTEFP